MTWADVKRTLTTPPPPRPPPPKYPTFTKDFFSTKSWGPGHLVGAGILVAGIVGVSKFFIDRGKEEAERARRLVRTSPPMPAPQRSDEGTKVAQTENARGEYGRKP